MIKDIPLIGTMSLVPQVVDSLKKEINDKSIPPVVAAGGISDGRGLAQLWRWEHRVLPLEPDFWW